MTGTAAVKADRRVPEPATEPEMMSIERISFAAMFALPPATTTAHGPARRFAGDDGGALLTDTRLRHDRVDRHGSVGPMAAVPPTLAPAATGRDIPPTRSP
jgi:hypothetical protein